MTKSRFDPMTVPSVHCEARKVAYRQTKDGLVVSFVIHPNDLPDALAIAPLGQRYMLVLAAIGDDETAVPPVEQYISTNVFDGTRPVPKEHADRLREKAHARYHSQTEMEKARDRAAILCGDRRFREWAGCGSTVEDAKWWLCAKLEIESRAEIATDVDVYSAFVKLETDYKLATRQIAEQR